MGTAMTTDPTPYNVADGFILIDGEDEHWFDRHDVDTMRATAADWHGGQASALYAFASTGTVTDRLAHELLLTIREADAQELPEESRRLTAIYAAVPNDDTDD